MPFADAELADDRQRSAANILIVKALRHVKFCSILSGFPTETFEKFSRLQNFAFDFKSRVITPKIMPPGFAQLAFDPQRSVTTVQSIGMLRHVRSRAISDRKFINFCSPTAKFSFEIV